VIRFIIRRLLLSIPVLLGVVFIVFLLVRVIPGDPCEAALQERATPETCQRFGERFGLNKPVLPFVIKDRGGFLGFGLTGDPASLVDNQFVTYTANLLTGNLGESIRNGQPVTEILVERMPTTIELTVYALLFAITVGMTLGVISAYRRNSAADVGTMVVANLGVSIPVFVLGLVLAFTFAIVLKDTFLELPPTGRLAAGFQPQDIAVAWGMPGLAGPPRTVLDFIGNMYTVNGLLTLNPKLFFDALRHLILPAVALGTIPMAIIARMTRSSLLDVLGQDYVRTARAKGMRPRTVMFRHGLRNALLPVVTVIGLSIGTLLSGAILTETIFGLTGMGRTIYESIFGRDYIVVQGFSLIVAVIYVMVNLVVDISYGYLDPRVRVA
jgi:ABC-type dipeptide/oligopeptide/nickel transport system permease component